jgi:hypothetical protein
MLDHCRLSGPRGLDHCLLSGPRGLDHCRGLAVATDDGFSADEREVLNRAVSLLARLTEL